MPAVVCALEPRPTNDFEDEDDYRNLAPTVRQFFER